MDDLAIGVVLWDGVEELDFAGPYEVLTAWARESEREISVRTVAETSRLAAYGVNVDADARFVDDGDIVTAAGVSAGIDMALHLVARLESPERARSVRRYIRYDPEPPV